MLNHWTGMGRLTADPILRTTQSNVPVVSFTLAVDRDYHPSGSKQTDFIACVAWRNTAEFVSKHFHKGSMAIVAGSLQSRQWEDRNGQKRTEWEIQVENIYFGEAKKEPKAPDIYADDMPDDGDIPF